MPTYDLSLMGSNKSVIDVLWHLRNEITLALETAPSPDVSGDVHWHVFFDMSGISAYLKAEGN